MSESKQELYPDSMAFEQWEYNGNICYLLHTEMGHNCGYVRFPKRPVKVAGYDGILDYVPVHGGITYAHNDEAGMVYGFDCAHYNDEHNPLVRDPEWLKRECQNMADGILLAAKFEDRYLRAEGDNEQRAAILAEYEAELGINIDVADNFGVMLNVLFGSL